MVNLSMKYSRIVTGIACVAALAAPGCGGGAVYATIGGTVTGLTTGSKLILLDNGTDSLTVANNGEFTFAGQIEAGSSYSVTISSQPSGETCVVSNAVNTVTQSVGNVTSIFVNCQATLTAANDVIGTVYGLAAGKSVTLLNDGTDSLTITGTGNAVPFVFQKTLYASEIYNVAVSTQPVGQTCTLTGNTGQMPPTGPTPSVVVTCS
jgi:hypothetical protein